MPKPSLQDIHPLLQERLLALAHAHREKFPWKTLVMIWGLRNAAEQLRAFKAGHTKLDGTHKVSVHQYGLAADIWVYLGASPNTPELLLGSPPRGGRLQLQLRAPAFTAHYKPMASLAAQHGLDSGVAYGDGPHLELPRHERIAILQSLLVNNGFKPGKIDGILGPRTSAAIDAAAKQNKVARGGNYSMPLGPPLWLKLHNQVAQ